MEALAASVQLLLERSQWSMRPAALREVSVDARRATSLCPLLVRGLVCLGQSLIVKCTTLGICAQLMEQWCFIWPKRSEPPAVA